MDDHRVLVRFVYGLLLTLLNFGCGTSYPTFDGERAFQKLQEQCAFGPRNPGSQGYQANLNYLTQQLTPLADTLFYQAFEYTETVEGKTYQLTNIVAQFNRHASRQLLLGAHWDTRPWADQDPDPNWQKRPIIGANDGASGVAILLELARIFKQTPPPIGITLVFFDGEDLGARGDPRTFAQGSLHFAKNVPDPKPEAAIILDMVGDTYLQLPIERYSFRQNPNLVKKLWSLARQLELPAFENHIESTIFDDHVPLYEVAGIPAVDIIDFQYPYEGVNYWHTREDIPRNCSAVSLQQVGTLLIHHIYGIK